MLPTTLITCFLYLGTCWPCQPENHVGRLHSTSNSLLLIFQSHPWPYSRLLQETLLLSSLKPRGRESFPPPCKHFQFSTNFLCVGPQYLGTNSAWGAQWPNLVGTLKCSIPGNHSFLILKRNNRNKDKEHTLKKDISVSRIIIIPEPVPRYKHKNVIINS